MAPHKDFPQSPHAILDPGIRLFPADEALRESSMEQLMPPLVAVLRRKVQEFRDGGYVSSIVPNSVQCASGTARHPAPPRISGPRIRTGRWNHRHLTSRTLEMSRDQKGTAKREHEMIEIPADFSRRHRADSHLRHDRSAPDARARIE
jgi:hypothetical protein